MLLFTACRAELSGLKERAREMLLAQGAELSRYILKIFALQYDFCSVGTGVADPGSGAFLTPGSGIRNRFYPDPGSRIPDPGSQAHIFESLVTIF
jgi:hypothetical protein